MRTKESQLTVNGRVVLVQRKRIKNMYLRVDPQTGWLKVSVPRLTPDTAIIGFVRGREEWIEKALAKAAERAAQPVRTFTAADRRAFRAKCAAAIERWQPLVGRRCSGFSVRDMKTRWGSCNTQTGHLNFNLKLLDFPQECLDYVVVHELCHLWVPGHSKAFWAQVERVCPDYRRVRKELRKKQ